MRKLIYTMSVTLLSLLVVGCFGMNEDDVSDNSEYKAVVISRTELENSVKTLPAKNVEKSGKIYIKDNLMFINDVNKGFHVFNYSNAVNPIKIGFIQIFGATDLAMRSNIVYINQATDLVTLTYNPSNNTINITDRSKDIFPQKMSPDGFNDYVGDNKIIIDWIKK